MTGSSVWAALEKSTVSRAEVSSQEKPVGLLQSRDRRELICMPRRQPASRAPGEQRQPNWLCRRKVLSYPHRGLTKRDAEHRTSNRISPHPSPTGSAGPVLAGRCDSHRSGGISSMWLFSHHELPELCYMRTNFEPWLCNF